LNWLENYITKSKTVSKPLSQLSDKQLIISIIQPIVFPLLEKTLCFFKTDWLSFVQGLRIDLNIDSKHSNLNPNKKQHSFKLYLDLKHQSSHAQQ